MYKYVNCILSWGHFEKVFNEYYQSHLPVDCINNINGLQDKWRLLKTFALTTSQQISLWIKSKVEFFSYTDIKKAVKLLDQKPITWMIMKKGSKETIAASSNNLVNSRLSSKKGWKRLSLQPLPLTTFNLKIQLKETTEIRSPMI